VNCPADCTAVQCNDAIDNDGDGATDFPADFGCESSADNSEINNGATECSDGNDNDGDGATDQDDGGCIDRNDNDETNCGDGICEGGENDVSCIIDCGNTWRVFLTNTTTNGGLGANPTDALDAADNICNIDAVANEYPGTYKAWLSTSTINAKDRIIDGAYRNIFGAIIANDINDLLDGTLDTAIYPGLAEGTTYTGTKEDGTLLAANLNCNDWTIDNTVHAGSGHAALTNIGWTNFGSPECRFLLKLYCFQVS